MNLWLLTAVLVAQTYYTPREAEALFEQANEAYSNGDAATARDSYQKLVARGYGNEDIFYNLGTVELALGHLGEAILNFERARRFGPAAPDLEANLALARSRQLDHVEGTAGEETFVQRLVAQTSATTAACTFATLWVLGFILLWAVWATPLRRLWAFWSLSILLLLLALPAGLWLAAHAYAREAVSEGIVLASSLGVHDFPKESAKVSFEVHAGLKVRVGDAQGKFVKIRLPNGLEGWAAREGIEDL